MDYRLKQVYEQMLAGKQSSNNSVKSLTEAYTSIYEKKIVAPPVQMSDLDVLSNISGVKGQSLNVLINLYQAVKDNSVFRDQVLLSYGTPKNRAYDASMPLNYTQLAALISGQKFAEKPFIVTYASGTRKLRTPSPLATRICEWGAITDAHVQQLSKDMETNKINPSRIGWRPLVIFALYDNFKHRISLKGKLPPGIGAELNQVETFNESLKELPPTPLLLPGDTNQVPGVLFNKARKVEGVGKADIALLDSTTGKDVFWISFKEDTYHEDPEAVPHFQQWGSLKGLYFKSEGIRKTIDQFLSNAANSSSFRTINVEGIPFNSELEQYVSSSRLLKTLKNLHAKGILKQIHIMPEKSRAVYLDLLKKSNIKKNPELTSIALKGIYGSEFEVDKKIPFSSENVNLILQTPDPIKFVPQWDADQNNIQCLEMVLHSGSHIIKNPNLPDHAQYLPCLVIRYTKEEYFLYNNDTEVVLGGRTLIYPIGKVRGSGIEIEF